MKVHICECSEGAVLSEDILNEHGVALVTKDTVINDYIIEKLIEMEIVMVDVYSQNEEENEDTEKSCEEFEKDYRQALLKIKEVLTDLSAGKALDYNKIIEIQGLIYKNIDKCDEIVACLRDIRQADEYTYNHCINVGFYCMLMGKWLGLGYDDTIKLIQAGLLHDIGKTMIPADVLNKKGKLTVEEFELIKKHTVYGYDILLQAKEIDVEVKKAVLLHHERVDGSGYPLSIPSDYIGLYTKIVAIADVYDAMTSDRPYKKRTTPFEAFKMFLSIGISIFDLNILYVFLNSLAANFTGINVKLDNGKEGRVVYVPPHNITKPVLCVDSSYIDLSREDKINIDSVID